MSYGRNYRSFAGKNGPGHNFFIKRPQILDGTASPSHDQHVKIHIVQDLNGLYYAVFCLFPLNLGRTQNKLHKGIAPSGNIHNIPDGRSGTGRYDANLCSIAGNRTLILGVKHSHFFQLVSQRFKPFK